MKNRYELIKGVYHIYLSNKKGEEYSCLVDEIGFSKLKEFKYKWHLIWSNTTKGYYAKATQYNGIQNGKPSYETVLMHRYLMDCPKDMTVDHLNYNTLDNRRENLRVVTLLENNQNRQNKANKGSTTGVRNVTYCKINKKYIVQFYYEGKVLQMGRFNTLKEAEEYANKNRHKYYKNIN